MCGSLTAPHGEITLTTRVFRSPTLSLQQLQAGASSSSPVQTSASTQESNGTAPSSSVSCPQVTHSAISPQVLAGPARNVTGDVMSATLAEDATQLSFVEFLERCNLLRVSPPHPQPNPTLLLDAATQTFPRTAPADVSTQLPLAEFSLGCIYSEDPLDGLVPPSAHGITCPTCSRPIPPLLLHAAAQTPSHSVDSADATAQPPLTEFFIGCIYSNDPLGRSVPPPPHGNASSAALPQPTDIATICSPSSTSRTSNCHVCTTAPGARLHSAPPPPPCLEDYDHLCSSHGVPVKAALVRPRLHTSTSVPSLQPRVSTIQVGTHPVRLPATYVRSAITAQAGSHHAIGAESRGRRGPFPKPRALVLPMVKFGQAKPDGLGHIDTADSDLMHHQYRLSVLQWNPGPASRNPTNIIAATCGRFHAVILQEASGHVTHISDQFIAYTGNTDLAILLNKDTFEPDPMVLAFKEDSTSKGTWGMVLLIVRGLLRRPSLSGTPTVAFCSVHIHNVVAKKRDASTHLLWRLRGYMKQHNVDFIGGDFNMSAFSTVGDVFSDPEFSAPSNSFLWGLGALENPDRECAGFSSCQSVHMSGVWIHTAATNTITLHLTLDHVTRPLTSLRFSIFASPAYLALTASCAVNMRNKEGLSADMTNTSVCEDDVPDRDVAHQSHVSAHLFPSSPITCESLGASCFAPH